MKEILKLLKKIPEDRVTTYKQLAKAADSHHRAVGKILNSNPDPERYPCYKVVKSDGSIGGYSGGKEKKRELLEEAGIEVSGGKVDLKRYLFKFEED